MPLEAGLEGRAGLTVTEADTAIALGSGDVPVLATPRVVALCEAATVAAVAPQLDAAATTVGTRVEIDHVAPTGVGAAVTARAELVAIDGRRLTFAVEATEGTTTIAAGTVVRVLVDRQRFLEILGSGV